MNDSRQRLFFALWPPADLASRLRRLARDNFDLQEARLLQREQLHLTLVYLGGCDSGQRRCAGAVAGRIKAESFTLSLSCLGLWSRPRVGWIAPQRTPPALQALVSRLQQGLGECGFSLDPRPWQAHLTLVRKLRRPPRHDALAEPLDWSINEFVLVESQTLPAGVRYRILQRWLLNGQHPD